MSQFDLKYRPLTFDRVIGNAGVKKLLLIRSKERTLADQSMMLAGPKGCGKTTLARVIAKAINCANLQEGEPCNECVNCLSISSESDTSFQEFDAGSHGTVDNIREMVKNADYMSLNGMQQVYIVDEAQRLSHAAQEAFLKAIESRLFIVILCTTDPEKVKVPIRSRVEEYPIIPPSYEELKTRMVEICNNENIEYDDDGLALIAQVKENCPRACFLALDTISKLGKISSDSVRQYYRFGNFAKIIEILTVLDVNPSDAFAKIDQLASEESPTWIRDHLVMAIASALRVGVGAKSIYPVDIGNFFANRGRKWAYTATSLSGLDRPSMSDIESVLLRDSQAVMHVPSVQDIIVSSPSPSAASSPSAPAAPSLVESPLPPSSPPSSPPPSIPSTDLVKEVSPPKSEKVKQVTVDGVNFSSNEALTSLDGKLIPANHKSENNENPVEQVQLNADHAPITEKEFSGKLLTRLGKH